MTQSGKRRTYISLFSSAGVGCYGFKMSGFDCIATNEFLAPRIEIQKVNNKCKYDSGYICGDITLEETQAKVFSEIAKWRMNENLERVDTVIASPPCQGMSSANCFKNENDHKRNSLVVEAIKLINAINPKTFVIENVRAFMKTQCTDIDGEERTIHDAIFRTLGENYDIYYEILNFKDYGVPSSRPRTITIGVSKELGINPYDLFPTKQDEITLRQAIGNFKPLEYGEKDKNDFLHFARKFPERQLDWIKDLKEGESAFDNPIYENRPWHINKNGEREINACADRKGKYTRMYWDKVAPCILTRSDNMSGQNTLHPKDNRVLSIRELMTLMTIPNEFKWTNDDDNITPLNSTPYLKKNELNIRRCIGESIPTHILNDIANKIDAMIP